MSINAENADKGAGRPLEDKQSRAPRRVSPTIERLPGSQTVVRDY